MLHHVLPPFSDLSTTEPNYNKRNSIIAANPDAPKRLRPDGQTEKDMTTFLDEGAHLLSDSSVSSALPVTPEYKFTIGHDGQSKYRFGFKPDLIPITDGGVAYGEDSANFGHIIPEIMSYMICADGHGSNECNNKVSQKCVLELSKYMTNPDNIEELRRAISMRDMPAITHIGNRIFTNMRDTCAGLDSGSTVTIAILFIERGNRYVLSMNVGDSPCIIIDNKTGRVIKLSQDHNWDNPAEYRKHCDFRKARGSKPETPCYNRFNNGSLRFNDKDGEEKPFLIYKKDSTDIDEDNRDYVWQEIAEMFPIQPFGGTQSHARYVEQVQDIDDGKWYDYGPALEHAHENWGSTNVVEKGKNSIQMTRSIGDEEYELDHNPSTILFQVPPGMTDITTMLGSDGVFDTGFFYEFGDIVKQIVEQKPDSTGQDIATYMIDNVLSIYKSGFTTRITNTVTSGVPHSVIQPTWDDISVIACRTIQS
jgi:serine/threonine protein phosphatase PrpC